MGLIGSIVGAGASIFGGIKAAQAASQVTKDLKNQRQDNDNWYDRRYNEDATQRADAIELIDKTRESIRQRNRDAAGRAAVGGATEESVAAARAQNNEALSQTMASINSAAANRKDAIEQQYMQNDQNIRGQLNNMKMQKAQNIVGAVQGVGGLVSQMPI